MKLLLILSLFVTSTLFAQSLTKIHADYRCEQAGGGIAFKASSNLKKAKVWQTDVGEDTGLALKVTSFSVLRCPGCYEFEAVLMKQVAVRGKVTNFKLKYEAQDPETGKWQPILSNVACEAVNP
ncbi:MAG: hypothetical protein H0V66_05560 [Bdellovibrionales bacterium]|nr:hypothetical protein [Bdellovibrionales bacterium]